MNVENEEKKLQTQPPSQIATHNRLLKTLEESILLFPRNTKEIETTNEVPS